MTIEAKRPDKVADLQIWCGNDLVVNLEYTSQLWTEDAIKKLWEESLVYFGELSDSLPDDRFYKVRLIYVKTQTSQEKEIFVPLRNNTLDDSLESSP